MTPLSRSPIHLSINPDTYTLWDFAGVDGQQAARALWGDAAVQIAPFQSCSTNLGEHPCSILRLCEANYRVALPTGVDLQAILAERMQGQSLNLWLKGGDRPNPLSVLVLPDGLDDDWLSQRATTKPIYSINPLPLHRAAPARIQGIAVLAWRHIWERQPRLELHTAPASVEPLRILLEAEFSPVSYQV